MTEDEVKDIAARLLDGALHKDVERTAAFMNELESNGSEAAVQVMLCWCDTLIRVKNVCRGGRIQLSWYDPATGGSLEPGEVPTVDQWAGQIIAARAAMDWEMFQALILAVPPDQQMHHVLHLLGVVSENLRTMMNDWRN